MKQNIIIVLSLVALLFSSCEHPMTMETDVHEDGSLDKTIAFEKGDSALITNNIFGIDSVKGWSAKIVALPVAQKETGSDKVQYKIIFKKQFESMQQHFRVLQAYFYFLHLNSRISKTVDFIKR